MKFEFLFVTLFLNYFQFCFKFFDEELSRQVLAPTTQIYEWGKPELRLTLFIGCLTSGEAAQFGWDLLTLSPGLAITNLTGLCEG